MGDRRGVADIGQIDVGERHRDRRGQRRCIGLLDEALLRDIGNHWRIVAAVDGDDNVLRGDAAMVIVDLHRVGQRDRLAIGEIVEIAIRRRERPALRALHAIGGIAQRPQRQPAELERAVGKARRRTGGADAGDLDLMRIGQVGIVEGDRTACGIRRRRTVGVGRLRDDRGLRVAGNFERYRCCR